MGNNTATNSADAAPTVLDEIKALLAGIGVTQQTVGDKGYANDVTALEAQVAGESGWYGLDRTYNLLNTSLHIPGADNKGIPDYVNLSTGVDANVSTLLYTSGNPYAKAVADLRKGADPTQYLTDIAASPWDAGRYGTKNGGANTLLAIYNKAKSSSALNTIGLQSAFGISKYGKDANAGNLDAGTVVNEGILPGAGEALNGAANAANSAISWTAGLSKLLGHLTSSSFWKRVGEGGIGVVMILVAVAMFNGKTIGAVTKAAPLLV